MLAKICISSSSCLLTNKLDYEQKMIFNVVTVTKALDMREKIAKEGGGGSVGEVKSREWRV